MDRRKFITRSLTVGAGLAFANPAFGSITSSPFATQSLEISLAQWSLHRKLFAVAPSTTTSGGAVRPRYMSW